jgi:glycerol-3-phosphate acyltransferase PlsY
MLMDIALQVAAVMLGYVLGSIPFGLVIVKLKTGKDIRTVESGRTGGTNAARAAGLSAGLLTAFLDILKGAVAVWIAQALVPGNHVIHVLAPIFVILGHNYSLFLMERDETGKLKFRGGAGGAPALGGAVGLWVWMFPIAFGLGALIWFTIGIASLTTMAIGLVVIIIFAVRSSMGLMQPIDIWYGVIAELLLIWALRPNIKKLISGNERVISMSLNGWLRARREKAKTSNTTKPAE